MKYRMRINGDNSMVLPIQDHSIEKDIHEQVVTVTDDAHFPPGSIPDGTLVTLFELIDEKDEVWALRRLDPEWGLLVSGNDSLSVQFKMNIVRRTGGLGT